MKKKLLLTLLVALVMALALGACNRNGDDDTPDPTPTPAPTDDVTTPPDDNGNGEDYNGEDENDGRTLGLPGTDRPVRVMNWGDEDTTLAERFYHQYGGTIEWVYASWDVYLETFLSMLMAGNPPDIITLQHVGLAGVIAQGHLMPLDDLLDFNAPHWVDVANNPMLMHGGQNMAVSTFQSIWYHMFYNRSMFFAAGVEYPSQALARGAWTWERAWEMSEALTDDTTGDGVHDVWGMASEDVHIPQMAMFATNQVGFIGQNEDGTFYNNVDNPRIAYLLDQFYDVASVRDIFYSGYGVPMFAQGRAAMLFAGYWYFFGSEEDEEPNPLWEMLVSGQVGMVPSPTVNGTLDEVRMGNMVATGVARNAANPEGAALLLDLQRRMAVEQTSLQDVDPDDEYAELHYLLAMGWPMEYVDFVYNLRIVPYTDLYLDFDWWDPFFGTGYGYSWTAMREGMWGDVQLVVDLMNDDL